MPLGRHRDPHLPDNSCCFGPELWPHDALADMPDVTRAREFAVRARAQMRAGNHHVAIVLLARAFHPPTDADGLDPWNPEAFYPRR